MTRTNAELRFYDVIQLHEARSTALPASHLFREVFLPQSGLCVYGGLYSFVTKQNLFSQH